jgi:hypothetical protein
VELGKLRQHLHANHRGLVDADRRLLLALVGVELVEDRAALRVLRGHVGEGEDVRLDVALLDARHQAAEDLAHARAASTDHDASAPSQQGVDDLVMEVVVRPAA